MEIFICKIELALWMYVEFYGERKSEKINLLKEQDFSVIKEHPVRKDKTGYIQWKPQKPNYYSNFS